MNKAVLGDDCAAPVDQARHTRAAHGCPAIVVPIAASKVANDTHAAVHARQCTMQRTESQHKRPQWTRLATCTWSFNHVIRAMPSALRSGRKQGALVAEGSARRRRSLRGRRRGRRPPPPSGRDQIILVAQIIDIAGEVFVANAKFATLRSGGDQIFPSSVESPHHWRSLCGRRRSRHSEEWPRPGCPGSPRTLPRWRGSWLKAMFMATPVSVHAALA